MLKGRNHALWLVGGVSALAIATPAFAQAQSQQAPAAASESGSGLADIVVTAQKREQNLQAVPIAISAIPEAKVAQLGIKDAQDITGLAPNVTISVPANSMVAGVISIRGIPSGAVESLSLDQANGLYVDGVYIARSGAASLDVSDIERVEVLRGPQGTLFGRNTTGGAISFITRDPSKTFRGSVEAGAGNYGQWNARGSIDPGEIMGISSTFSYSHSQHFGYVDNILQPSRLKDPGARQQDAFRAALKADIGGTGSIKYIFDYSNVRGNSYSFQLINASDGSAMPPVQVDGLSVPMIAQAPVTRYLSEATFTNPACAALAAPTHTYRDKVCFNSDNGARDQIWGHNLQIQNDFGGFKIKSTTGYRIWHSDNYGSDMDGLGQIQGPLFTSSSVLNGMPLSTLQYIYPTGGTAAYLASQPVPTTTRDLFTTQDFRKQKQFSEEVEVSGDTDHLDWVVGGFYFYEKGSEYNPQNSGYVLDTNAAVFTSATFGGLAPLLQAGNPARYRLVVTNSLVNYLTNAESVAVYGQGTYYVDGRDGKLSLTGGLRYTWDNKSIILFQNGPAPLTTPDSAHANFQRLTWNAMARYAFTHDISVYARAASGYRSGGFNPSDTPPLTAFKPEKLTSFELGLKSELLNRHLRFNLAGYFNKYKDLAVTVPVPASSTGGAFNTHIVNAGSVDYAGVEVEGQAILTDNFSIDGNFGYVDVDYKKFNTYVTTLPGAPAIDAASITHASYTSKYTANVALNAQFPIGNDGAKLIARVGYTYLSPQYSFVNVLSAPYSDMIQSDPQHLVDAQIVLDKVSLGGIKAQVKFWAKNLTNEHNLVRAIDFGQLGYAGGYYGEPRTYGATVGFNF
ncbi:MULTISPECIES: TonB-dependent receptor [unclassified Sphingomonas]|uniref:TonB-dependent receptor n=1 Tax=unclassified Sphingomonas TaxID=196159 RepID=UPI00092BB67C|nr:MULTISPECIES: TonB-dependent receptor [unclassified Sphingomonas]MBN8848074.1 TonB-dependent receptor [Sphingomonas sp.]OJV28908.1 MAG: TonB-dependent receptor [Sphingomonas sp. 67-36]